MPDIEHDKNPEQLAEAFGRYGVDISDIALILGIDEDEVEARFGAKIAAGAAEARARVLQAAYVLASSGKNFQATDAWLRENVYKGRERPAEPAAAVESTPIAADVTCLAVARQIRGR